MKRNALHWQMLSTQLHVLTSLRLGGKEEPVQAKGNVLLFGEKCSSKNYSYKFNDYAVEFYSFVVDNYAPFYSVPIECNERDALYDIDGLLYNESDLQFAELYSATQGYSEINLAAFAMLGKRFCTGFAKFKNRESIELTRIMIMGQSVPLSAAENAK